MIVGRGGIAAHVDVHSAHWGLVGDYVTALRSMTTAPVDAVVFLKSRAWAYNIQLLRRFMVGTHSSVLTVSYEHTGHPSVVRLPESRVQLSYQTRLFQGVDFILQVAHSRAFSELIDANDDSFALTEYTQFTHANTVNMRIRLRV